MTRYTREASWQVGAWIVAILLCMFLLALTAGCASAGNFRNRVYCSADRTEAAFTSWYLDWGVGAAIDQRDAAVICAPSQAASTPTK